MISRAWRHLHFTLCELRVRVCVWHIVRHSQQTATEKLNSCLSATFVDLTVIILFFFLHVYKLKLQGIVVLWLNTLSNICQSIKKNYRSLEGPVGNCFVLFSGDSRFLMCETEWIYLFFPSEIFELSDIFTTERCLWNNDYTSLQAQWRKCWFQC